MRGAVIETELTVVSCSCSPSVLRNSGSISSVRARSKPWMSSTRVGRHLRLRRAQDRRELVDLLEPRLDARELLLGHEVGLVEQQPVGERHLLDRLVLGALGLLLVEVLLDVLRVDERHDAVEPRELLHLVVDEEGLRHRRRVGHPRRLDDDAVERGARPRARARQSFSINSTIRSWRTAQQMQPFITSMISRRPPDRRLDRVLLQTMSLSSIPTSPNSFSTTAPLLAVRRREDVVEQRRLAAAEEAADPRARWRAAAGSPSGEARRAAPPDSLSRGRGSHRPSSSVPSAVTTTYSMRCSSWVSV